MGTTNSAERGGTQSESANPPAAGHSTTSRLTEKAREVAPAAGLPIALCLIIVVFSVIEPGTFPTAGNFKSIIVTEVAVLLLATSVSFPLRAGDFDLSVAAMMIVSGAVVVRLTASGVPVAVSIILTLLAGGLVGAVNAAGIVFLRLNSFIVTLATGTVLEGLGYLLAHNSVLLGVPSALMKGANTQVGPFPLSVYYAWALVLLTWGLFEWTPYGRYLLVVGTDRAAADRLGLPVRAVRTSAYVVAGIFAAFTGLVLVGFLGSVDPSSSGAYLLPPYAAVFLGSTTIRVGEFNSLGTLAAVYFIAIGISGLELLGVAAWIEDVFSGAALLAGLVAARILSRAEERVLSS
jgi:ribose transport system permease protein